jgi:hypothetical protein
VNRREFLKQSAAGLALTTSATVPGAETTDDAVRLARSLRISSLEHGEFWDVKRVVEVLVKCGANAIRCDVGIYRGLVTMYPSRYLPAHPDLNSRNQLRDMVEECGKHGIGVFPYNAFYGAMAQVAFERHRDWAIHLADGSLMMRACHNNPDYVRAYANACKEIVESYDVVGMYFDGPAEPDDKRRSDGRIEQGYCFCPHCRAVFRQLFGRDMPGDLERQFEPQFRREMLAAHMYGVRSFTETVTRAIKSVRNIPVVVNLCDPTIRVLRHPSMESADGALAAEISRSTDAGSKVPTTYMNALARAKTGVGFGKAAWCYCPIGPYEQHVTYDDLETKIFGLTQLAHGATPLMENLQALLYDPDGIDGIREVFTMMKKHGPLYVDFNPVPFVALHCSALTMVKANAEDPTERIGHWNNNDFRGAFALLTNAHIQFDVLHDSRFQAEQLKRYQVLYLPNSMCLSEQQVAAVKDFVASGGGLLATCRSSLCDADGKQRPDFALKELFQASYRGEQKLTLGRLGNGRPYLRISAAHPVTAGVRVNKLLPCGREPFPRVAALPGGETVAKIYLGDTGEEFVPIRFAEDNPAAVIAGQYGKGRVVYMASAIDLLYNACGLRLLRTLVAGAIEWLSGGRNPLRTDGPACVVASLTERGDQRALHLINYTGDMREMPGFKVDWVAPLSNLRFTLGPARGRRLNRARLLSTGTTLPVIQSGETAWVTLPKLGIYECILLDYSS